MKIGLRVPFSPLWVYIFGFLSFYFCSFKLRRSFLLPLNDDSLYWGGGASHLEMISLQPATPATSAEMVSSKDSNDYLSQEELSPSPLLCLTWLAIVLLGFLVCELDKTWGHLRRGNLN